MAFELDKHITLLLKEKNSKAINLLYENYSNSLFGVIKSIIDNDKIAEDALQETFIKVWKNADKFDPKKAKLYTWLHRIAKNTAIDKVRSFKNKQQKEVHNDHILVNNVSSYRINQDTIDLKEHVAKLDPKYQIVLNALYFEGMTQQDASEELEIPLGTIKSRLKIALRELKKIYKVQNCQ